MKVNKDLFVKGKSFWLIFFLVIVLAISAITFIIYPKDLSEIRLTTQDQTNLVRLKKTLVSPKSDYSFDEKAIVFGGELKVPAKVVDSKYPLYFTAWYDYKNGEKKLTLQSNDSDDLLVYDFIFDFKKQNVKFVYAYQNDIDDDTGVSASRTYKITKSTDNLSKIEKVAENNEVNYSSKKDRVNAQKDIVATTKHYQKILTWLLNNGYSYQVLQKFAEDAKNTKLRKYEQHKKAVKAKAKSEKRKSQVDEEEKYKNQELSDKNSYHIELSDSEWRKYILLRAKSLGLKNPVITTKQLTSSEREEYFDFDFNYTGDIKGTNDVYYRINSNGVEYVVVLPTILYNTKALKNEEYGGDNTDWYHKEVTDSDFADYFYNGEYPSTELEPKPSQFVKKQEKPTTDEIVFNIMVVKKIEVE